MTQIRTNIAELKGKVDFGIITIREDEFAAVLQRLPVEQLVVGRQRYAMSRLKTVSDDEYVIASVRCLEPGTGLGQSVARTMIDELNPQWILLVGIAGSMPDYEHTLGDVILASRLHDFSVSAIIENNNQEVRQEFASGGGPMHPDVQNLLAALPVLNLVLDKWYTPTSLTVPRPAVGFGRNNFYGDANWKKKVKECLDRYFGAKSGRQLPKAFTASVASSGLLLKDTQTASLWLRTSRDIIGVEMELAGVYQAAWDFQKPVLAIRGLSDIVGFKRSPDWTSYACNSAAAFTVALLRSRPIIPLESKEPAQGEERDSPAPLQNQQVGVFKQKPPNPPPFVKHEELFSNLLEVTYFPETLYSVETSCKDKKEVWALLNAEIDHPPNDWIYKGKMLYAFHNFGDPIWQKVCDVNLVERHNTSHWAASPDPDRRAEFIELLKGCFREFGLTRDLLYIHKQWVSGKKKTFKYLYFAPTTEFSTPPQFLVNDFIDPDGFINSLKDEQTPLAKYLFEHFPPDTQGAVKSYSQTGSAPNAFLAELACALNEILKCQFYEPALFEGIFLRWETNHLVENDPTEGKDLENLNRLLIEDAYRKAIRKRTLCPRTMVRQSLYKAQPRDVFRAYFSNRTGNFRYYRHTGFRYQFVRVDGKWYLEITPTYHYTFNGYRVCFFYEDELKGIKLLEKNEAVFRQVMFLSKVLEHDDALLIERKDYPYLKFGKLLEFDFDYGVRDDLWIKKESLRKTGDNAPRRRRPSNLFT
jgi:nucleoside phosphorylase